MKKSLVHSLYMLLLLSFLCLPAGCGLTGGQDRPGEEQEAFLKEEAEQPLSEGPLWSDPGSLKAVIISDLHFTKDQSLYHLLIPGLAEAERITDALTEEVIGLHPDVLIMTGDNTNSGDPADAEALAGKLQKVREAGVSIILIPGNHDYDQMDAAAFEKTYFDLLDPVDRDPSSLSYTAVIKDVVFLAMDDSAMRPGGQGEFSPESMQWLEDQLEAYQGHTVIFLSHHNVLYGFGEKNSASHLIRNPDPASLLTEKGVRLALTGHMHFQYITERDGLWEILSGMPFSGNHLMGHLAAGRSGLVYYASPMDLHTYDRSLEEDLARLDQESADSMELVFSGILDEEGLKGTRKLEVMALLRRFLSYNKEGTLADHIEELRSDPAYDRMLDALRDYNYGPWIQAMIEATRYPAARLRLTW